YVLGEDRTWYGSEPFDAADVHYVRGNLLVLVFAGDSTKYECRRCLERQRNHVALLNLACESPDLSQSGDDLFFTLARVRRLVEHPQFVLCPASRVIRKLVPRMTDQVLLDGCLFLIAMPTCTNHPQRHIKISSFVVYDSFCSSGSVFEGLDLEYAANKMSSTAGLSLASLKGCAQF